MICSLIICNKDILEGNGCLNLNVTGDTPGWVDGDTSDNCEEPKKYIDEDDNDNIGCYKLTDTVWVKDNAILERLSCVTDDDIKRAWVTHEGINPTDVNPQLQINEFNNILSNMDAFYSSTDNSYDAATIINNLMEIAGVTEDQNGSQDNIKNNIRKLSDFGKLSNGNSLNYLEMGIRKFTNGDPATIKKNIESKYNDKKVCEIDLYTYVSAFLISFYNSFNQNNASSDEYSNIMVISNRLTKYIPEILDKIDEIYKTCTSTDPDINELKHKIIKDIHNTLLKNNVTKISFTGLGDIMKKLQNVKSIYILLFMLCLTFIVIKFMGMFKLSVNV